MSHAETFAALLNEKFADPSSFACNVFGVDKGRKFDRVWAQQQDGGNKHVHAFVDRETGEVYKSAGWKAPAKDARYPSVEAAADAADLYGSYLYKR